MKQKNILHYNTKFAFRWNRLLRKHFVNPKLQAQLQNHEFSILCNNCTGGILYHDLHEQFRSPTINLFFYSDHFFKFVENLDHYLSQELVPCHNPIYTPRINYPVCNLGDLELHFLHYHSFEEAKTLWDRRKARINKENLFIMWTFMGAKTSPEMAKRFEDLPFERKVAFSEKDFPEYPSIFNIKGYEQLGVLTQYDNLRGKYIVDQFDYVQWLNQGVNAETIAQ